MKKYKTGKWKYGSVSALMLAMVLIAMIVLSIILGTQLYYHGSLLDLFLILVPAAVGAGLLLRALLLKPENTEKEQ